MDLLTIWTNPNPLNQNTKMALKLGDPVQFLQNLVIKKGRSDLEGVYLVNASVVASASEDYGYEYDTTQVERDLENMWTRERAWNDLLVALRRDGKTTEHISFTYGSEQSIMQFFQEGHDLSAHVYIPEVDAGEFVYDVTYFTTLLSDVARFTGKNPTTVKFTLGYCLLCWSDMVKRGEVQEIDVGY